MPKVKRVLINLKMDEHDKIAWFLGSFLVGAYFLFGLGFKGWDYFYKPREATTIDSNKNGIEEILVKSRAEEEIYYPLEGTYKGKKIYFSYKGHRLERDSNKTKIERKEDWGPIYLELKKSQN